MVVIKIISLALAAYYFYRVLHWDVYDDYKKWLNNYQSVNHNKEAVTRGLLLIPFVALITWFKIYENIWTWYTLLATITSSLLTFSIWWELFDGWYNNLRGFHWRFNGSADPDDSKLDRLLYGLGDTAEAFLKLGLITLCITLYLIF